jgi:hypothetical protein
MAAPVWVLSVDLQTKTATFTTGLAEAARSARGSFQEIQGHAKSMGEGVEKGSINAQQALGVLSNTIRGDVENAVIDLVNELSHTSVVMAALPIAAAVGALGLLVNIAVEVAAKFKEWREESGKLNDEMTRFGTTVDNSLGDLDDRLLEAAKRTDELRNDHVAALNKELELIDHQSMAALVHQLETVAKAADAAFEKLQTQWYNFGIGSEGAKHALDDFQVQYNSLMAQGKGDEAGGLLSGTLAQARQVLEMQKLAQNANVTRGALGVTGDQAALDRAKSFLAISGEGVGFSEKEVKAQEALVTALSAQLSAQTKISELKNREGTNAKLQNSNGAFFA